MAPIAATLVTKDVDAELEEDFDFFSTYGWHPLGVEAALATQQYWREHKGELLTNVQERSDEMRHRLSITEFKTDDVELRIQGLAIGIGLGDKEYASSIQKRCEEHGLILTAEEDSIAMYPPLTIDHDTLAEALDILADAVQR